ncbi:unnamed protein product [Blepharisma stoltei]|uniref:Uncharacterized protein n=1 Tax=Blepharisma stoltei TaxID=1481888 RepID=A0AAU9JPS4_9CILI|nr:unnamed protein product [Blepharisma stoltei]
MNYGMYNTRYMRPQTNQPQPNQPNNFAVDVHSFMEGLSRVVQILYSSIPVLEFSKLIIKYSWKFLRHLGSSTFGTALNASGLSHHINNEQLMELLWKQPSQLPMILKGIAMLALAFALLVVYRRAQARNAKIEEEFDEFEVEEMQEEEKDVVSENIQEPATTGKLTMERKSEEDTDRPIFIQENYYPEPIDQYAQEYPEYSTMF